MQRGSKEHHADGGRSQWHRPHPTQTDAWHTPVPCLPSCLPAFAPQRCIQLRLQALQTAAAEGAPWGRAHSATMPLLGVPLASGNSSFARKHGGREERKLLADAGTQAVAGGRSGGWHAPRHLLASTCMSLEQSDAVAEPSLPPSPAAAADPIPSSLACAHPPTTCATSSPVCHSCTCP